MNLITNAIASIELGLDDFNSGDDKRLVSAVRNCYAGILLLFKEKLLSLSPSGSNEVLLRSKVIPKTDQNGNLSFVGKGNTVSYEQIKTRFKNLGIRADWDRMSKINDIRNNMEHYHCGASRDAIRGMLSNTFLVMRDFMTHELNIDPRDSLSDSAWDTLLSVSEVFEREREECVARLAEIDWESDALSEAVLEIACNACGSQLLSPTGDGGYLQISLTCRTCGEEEDADSFIPRAISDHFTAENYFAIKDGGEEACIMCPHCLNESYVMDERKCAYCGEGATHTCMRCGTEIPACEITDGSLCSWCEHMSSKDD